MSAAQKYRGPQAHAANLATKPVQYMCASLKACVEKYLWKTEGIIVCSAICAELFNKYYGRSTYIYIHIYIIMCTAWDETFYLDGIFHYIAMRHFDECIKASTTLPNTKNEPR